jgi:spore coat protein CotH
MEEKYINLNDKVYKANEIDKAAEIAAIVEERDRVQQDKADTVASYDARIAVLTGKIEELEAL